MSGRKSKRGSEVAEQKGQADDGRGFEAWRPVSGGDQVALVEVVDHVDLPAHVRLAVTLEEIWAKY